jgi:DHA1 family inner membrane transport protein
VTSKHKNPILLIFLLWLAGLAAAGQFAKFSVIFEHLQQIYPEAGSTLGILVSFISVLGIFLGLIAGMVVARLGMRNLLVFALVLGAFISMFHATLPSLSLMLISRLFEGLSHLLIVVAAPTLIAQIAPTRLRPVAMTLWGTFFGVSFAIVAFAGIPLVNAYGAAAFFAAHGAFMALMAGVLWAMLPSARAQPENTERISLSLIFKRHLETYNSPSKAAPALGWLFYTITFVAFLTLLPGFVDAADRHLVATMMPLAGIIVSMSIGVLLLRYISAVSVIVVGFSASLAVVLLLWAMPDQPMIYIALMGALGLVQGASFAAVPQLNDTDQDRAYANGAMAQMGNLGNSLGTPVLLLLVSLSGFNGVIGFSVVCYILAISLHLWLAKRRSGQNPA